tara:strand:+ start:51 stop:185 length:135 start_codon:yes stop_codon:yes gene_type:complete
VYTYLSYLHYQAVVGPLLSIFTVLFLFRVVLSWFPKCAPRLALY